MNSANGVITKPSVRSVSQTIDHIERILAADAFYLHLGANGLSVEKQKIRLTRRTIKIYIQRLRKQIGKALNKVGLSMRPEDVLVSEETELLNVTAYRLAISCEFVHQTEPRVRRQPCRPLRWTPATGKSLARRGRPRRECLEPPARGHPWLQPLLLPMRDPSEPKIRASTNLASSARASASVSVVGAGRRPVH